MTVQKSRRFFRPRFTLAALLVLVTVVAIPLSYVPQRRAWNLRRAKTIEELAGKKFTLTFENGDSTELGHQSLGGKSPELKRTRTLESWWEELCKNNATGKVIQVASGPLTLENSDMAHRTSDFLTDEDLVRLRDFPELENVHLWQESKITDDGLTVLAALPRLHTITFQDVPLCTGSFLHGFSPASHLHTIRFSDLGNLSSVELRKLSQFKQLKLLWLNRCPNVNDANLRDVNLSASVCELFINETDLGDETIGRWLSQVNLEHLDLNAKVTRTIAPTLGRHSALKSLRVTNAPLIDDDFSFLSRCEKLRTLELTQMPITGSFLGELPRPELVKVLRLTTTLLSDENLRTIRRFTNLNQLSLDWTPISGEGFNDKVHWPNFGELSLCGTRFSDEGKTALAKWTRLGTVNLPSNWTSDDNQRFQMGCAPIAPSLNSYVAEETAGFVGRYDPRWNIEKIDNCPAELMKPVANLQALGLAEEQELQRRQAARQ